MDKNIPATDAVVVAIDDSNASRAALAWAAEYAWTTQSALRAVHVVRNDFSAPMAWTPGLRGAPRTASASEIDLVRKDVRDLFNAVVPEPSWTLEFLNGAVSQEIVRYAQGARLLVIGAREHRGLERLLVGSVSHYCLNHAKGPIVAVPAVAPLADPNALDHGAIPLPSAAMS